MVEKETGIVETLKDFNFLITQSAKITEFLQITIKISELFKQMHSKACLLFVVFYLLIIDGKFAAKLTAQQSGKPSRNETLQEIFSKLRALGIPPYSASLRNSETTSNDPDPNNPFAELGFSSSYLLSAPFLAYDSDPDDAMRTFIINPRSAGQCDVINVSLWK